MSQLESYVECIKDQYQIGSLSDEINTNETKNFAPDSAQWFEWLASLKAFRFVGKQGNFTARQERIVGKDKKQKGESYWYAYRKFQGHQFKRYLGINSKITIEHLEETARQIEEAIKQRLGIQQLPKPEKFKPITEGEKLLLQRIKKQEQTIEEQLIRIAKLENLIGQRDQTIGDLQTHIAEQEQLINDLKKQVKMFETAVKPIEKKKAPPQTDIALPEGFTYLSDFCTLHHVPYRAAADLFPRAIRGQWIIVQRRKQAIIGARGRHDFYVQLHTRADYRTCDDCPHQDSPVV